MLFNHINRAAPWLSWPFMAATSTLSIYLILSFLNNWSRRVQSATTVLAGAEPLVATIVPTAGEPIEMLRRTMISVLDQDWPDERLCLLIGDDSHRDEVSALVHALQQEYPAVRILYYRPPPRGSSYRRGDAKAGNLNAGLDTLRFNEIDAAFIETRDADDLVGDTSFLRRCLGPMMEDSQIAYAQTIKESLVTPGDPFGNNDPLFYRGGILSRQAANAVFPCGSGLVWRHAALQSIGDFPSWNLVEDLQSGMDALRRGWHGAYVPIVGAVGQTAPEDIPNLYKQRGTWAIDTVRLVLFRSMRGLNIRQKLHFLEMGLHYISSPANLLCFLLPAISLIAGVPLLTGSNDAYVEHFWATLIAMELYLVALNGRAGWKNAFRSREIWIGLAPVYAAAIFKAIVNGRNKKPTYRVTRKSHLHAWYWRQTLPQAATLILLVAAMAKAVATGSFLQWQYLGFAYWWILGTVLMGSFLRKSWFGLHPGPKSAFARFSS
ncbi:glycosyltransferase [Micromonospora profundi]|uniref:glycosyltransferase n=1 Tax=Micromonospora profundi TaxID=1420889 RepID=UPI002FF06496